MVVKIFQKALEQCDNCNISFNVRAVSEFIEMRNIPGMFLLLQVWLLSGYSEVEGLMTCSSESEKIKIVQTSSFLVASFIEIFK